MICPRAHMHTMLRASLEDIFWNAEADRAGAPYLSHYAMLRGRRCPCHLRPWAQPLAEIRSYYGEKVRLRRAEGAR